MDDVLSMAAVYLGRLAFFFFFFGVSSNDERRKPSKEGYVCLFVCSPGLYCTKSVVYLSIHAASLYKVSTRVFRKSRAI